MSMSRMAMERPRLRLTAEVVENNGIKPADLKKAVDAVKQYKADMIREWKAYFGDED